VAHTVMQQNPLEDIHQRTLFAKDQFAQWLQ